MREDDTDGQPQTAQQKNKRYDHSLYDDLRERARPTAKRAGNRYGSRPDVNIHHCRLPAPHGERRIADTERTSQAKLLRNTNRNVTAPAGRINKPLRGFLFRCFSGEIVIEFHAEGV